jgi:acrylyl-CoA reductase (NADPH)
MSSNEDHMNFRAYRVDKPDGVYTVSTTTLTEADLPDGDVTLRVLASTVNYKDGLALTGKAPVVRKFPLVPGIDLAGEVISSNAPQFKPGDKLVLTGCGVGETHDGAYAGRAKLKAEWLVKLPEALSPHQAMAIGTAGFTAMQCVIALERHGMTPDRGPVLVTGAAGGVGSVAVALLSRLGWQVIASTGRMAESDYLKGLGASEIIDRAELSGPAKPLAKERWAAVIDTVGSHTLANVLSMTRYGGAVAACGLAQGMDLPTSVAPFILRNVALLGVDSVGCPRPLREEVWKRLAQDLDLTKLGSMTRVISFDDLPQAGRDILAGQVRGRIVVDMSAAGG